MSESSGQEREKNIESEISDFVPDGSCFGEYGFKWFCSKCRYRLTCKNFAHDKQEAIYLRSKGKYKGRGKFRGKDQW